MSKEITEKTHLLDKKKAASRESNLKDGATPAPAEADDLEANVSRIKNRDTAQIEEGKWSTW